MVLARQRGTKRRVNRARVEADEVVATGSGQPVTVAAWLTSGRSPIGLWSANPHGIVQYLRDARRFGRPQRMMAAL
jgi:hypothetical protein